MKFKLSRVVLFCLLLSSCKNSNKTGIEGDENKNNNVIIGDNNIISEKHSAETKAPSDFFSNLTKNINYNYIVQQFGEPKEKTEEYYIWELENLTIYYSLVPLDSLESPIIKFTFNDKSLFETPNNRFPKPFGVLTIKDLFESYDNFFADQLKFFYAGRGGYGIDYNFGCSHSDDWVCYKIGTTLDFKHFDEIEGISESFLTDNNIDLDSHSEKLLDWGKLTKKQQEILYSKIKDFKITSYEINVDGY